MMQAMQYDIEEVYTQSIMLEKPTVVVEGVSDVPVYDNICTGTDCDVIAIETVQGYSEGCESVVSAMNQLQELPESGHKKERYILGVIDKDVRDFREEVPANNLIFVLNQYSIESHFVAKESLSRLLMYSTRITGDLNTDALRSKIMECIESSLDSLYLVSLESLKGALDSGYDADFCYSYGIGRIKDSNLVERIRSKEGDLINFSRSLGINFSLDSLRFICKGKWLLSAFCEQLEGTLSLLPGMCSSGEINRCQFCISQAEEKCLYKIRKGVTNKFLEVLASQDIDNGQFEYIKDRIKSMANQ